ncbi:YceD family protein [Candidatus Thioglobus sp.]|uniref:YceD family protein n=1 Tax=Candidatus Thioglobus sp. TaxID=2026721 RepID=UPI00261FFEDC|nr:YceD family protein [Candidatus Thioglobus sp.]MDG2394920.1 YceD family protein [Candidatus Thioglobus sp.]
MQGIPDNIKLLSFAKKGLIFSQTYSVKDFPRINEIVTNTDDKVKASLSFYIENGKIPCIEGSIEIDVALDCQRCLDEVKLNLNPTFKLAFIIHENQAEELDPSFETILNADEEFSTIEFLTDEVLISIPMIPMHSHECQSYKDKSPVIEQEERKNPFAILEQLKNSTKE